MVRLDGQEEKASEASFTDAAFRIWPTFQSTLQIGSALPWTLREAITRDSSRNLTEDNGESRLSFVCLLVPPCVPPLPWARAFELVHLSCLKPPQMKTVSCPSQLPSSYREFAQRLKYASICVCEPMADLIGELAALCAAISWTFSAVFYRKALSVASPFQANLIRFTSVSAALVALLATVGQIVILTSLPISASAIAALSGIVGLVLGDTLYMFALRSLGVSRAVPICSIYPLFNLLIAVFLKGERITSLVVLGAVGIVAGTWLISSKKPNSDASSEGMPRKGFVMALSTAVVWSVSMTLLSLAVTSPGIIGLNGVLAIMSLRVLAAWIVMLALSPVLDPGFGFLKMSWRTWLLMALGGLIGIGVGNFLLSYSFLYTQEARAVPISSTTPFFSVIAGIVLLHEPVTPWIVLGSLAIVLGTFLLFI